MIQKDDANCIYIGEWLNEVKILSDKPTISQTTV
jgi:hypothetical protein